MKRIKKLASLFLAMVMVFAMSATAFAAETEPLTDDGQTTEENGGAKDQQSASAQKPTISSGAYEIYQIFTGEYETEEKLLYNIKWGQNGTGEKDVTVPEGILNDLEAVQNESLSDTDQLAIINKYADLDSIPFRTGNETTYEGLTPGYYLVKGTVTFSNNTTAETLYVVEVVNGTLTFQPKVDVPTVDKKIVEGTEKSDTNEASINEEVNYEIIGTMPSNIDSYKTYYYLFTDTLSKGLTFKQDSIKVTVNDVDVTNYFYKGVGEYNATNGTTIEVGIKDVKALSLVGAGNITADTKIVLTYTATLNENAVIAGNGNPNDVKLTYSNNPNNSGDGSTTPPENPEKPTPDHPTGETPKIEVVTYTTELTITKTDENNNILTEGVEFTLTGYSSEVTETTRETYEEDEDGEYWLLTNGTYTTTPPTEAEDETDNTSDYASTTIKYKKVEVNDVEEGAESRVETTLAVNDKGQVTFSGLGAGTYTITETKTPAGYNTIEPITFTISFDKTTKKFSSNNSAVTVNGTTNMLESTIINQKGSLLPSTGGIGTTIFYVVGAILVIGAGILLVTKKRMSAR